MHYANGNVVKGIWEQGVKINDKIEPQPATKPSETQKNNYSQLKTVKHESDPEKEPILPAFHGSTINSKKIRNDL